MAIKLGALYFPTWPYNLSRVTSAKKRPFIIPGTARMRKENQHEQFNYKEDSTDNDYAIKNKMECFIKH